MNLHPIRLALLALFALAAFISSAAAGQETASVAPDKPVSTNPPEQAITTRAEQPLPPEFNERYIADESAVLRVWNRRIVELRARVADLEPFERVAQAAERIDALSDQILNEDVWHEITEIRGDRFALIGIKDQVLLPLRIEDLEPTSKQTLEQSATEVAERIQEVLRAKAEQRRLPNLLEAIGLSLVATLLFLLLVSGIFRLRRWLSLKLTTALRQRELEVSGFDLKPYLRNMTRGTVTLVSWALILPLAYLWLTFVFKRFPFTRPWGVGLGRYLLDLLTDLSLGAITAIPGLFTVFLIFLFTRFLTRIVEAFFLNVENESLQVSWLQPETAKATRRLTIVLMWIFALTVAYPYIPGSNSAAFKGVSVFVGLMVSLGATGLVNQIVSGMVIVYTRAFRPGEFVEIGDTEGVVEEIGVLSTKLLTRRREQVTIPNAVLVGTRVVNYSREMGEDGAVIYTTVTIGYDAPWRQVEALLKLAASRCPKIREHPAARVQQRALSDFYVEYRLLVNIDDPAERYVILSDLHAKIQDAFNEHGVQILSPHFEAQPAEAVWVPREKWVVPPAEAD
jgi:small-conductance mechanosensitive channel